MKGKSNTVRGVWKCKQCSKEFRYESDKRRHELSHVAPQFECQRCCKKFTYLSALRRHEKTHERSGSVQCTQCGGHFRDEVLLKRHQRYSHKGTYKCDKCSATFNSEPALRTHTKTHKPESERRFRCSYGCGKTFNFSHHLKHHEMTHTNIKQHFCRTCGKGFIQSHHLKTHEKTHEPSIWLPCTVSDCKKKFVDEYARKRHLATHRNTYNKGLSSDSSVAPKTSPSEDSQDGERHPSQGKICRNVIVKCESTQAKEILYSPLIDCKSEDSENNRALEKYVLNDEYNNLDEREDDFVNYGGIKTCETAIGSCLVAADSNIDQNCLCAQMSNFAGETVKEFVISPKNKTLNVNAKDFLNKSHESDCWLHGSVHKGDKKFVNQSNPQGIISLDKNHDDTKSNTAENSVDTCTTAIGSCLVTRDSDKDDNRGRISSPREEIVLKSNNEILAENTVKECKADVSTVSSFVNLQQDIHINSCESVPSKCEGCACANICSISDKIACQREAPNIECRPGGIVKLKDIFDFDFQARVKNDTDTEEIKNKMSDSKSSNFKSCKDIIGNCIVSGNSTMGEGCLCARMMVDDQAMPEEIDEITPCPQL